MIESSLVSTTGWKTNYALYHAKKSQRGGAVLFDTDHEQKINLASRIESALKQANLEEEFAVSSDGTPSVNQYGAKLKWVTASAQVLESKMKYIIGI